MSQLERVCATDIIGAEAMDAPNDPRRHGSTPPPPTINSANVETLWQHYHAN